MKRLHFVSELCALALGRKIRIPRFLSGVTVSCDYNLFIFMLLLSEGWAGEAWTHEVWSHFCPTRPRNKSVSLLSRFPLAAVLCTAYFATSLTTVTMLRRFVVCSSAGCRHSGFIDIRIDARCFAERTVFLRSWGIGFRWLVVQTTPCPLRILPGTHSTLLGRDMLESVGTWNSWSMLRKAWTRITGASAWFWEYLD